MSLRCVIVDDYNYERKINQFQSMMKTNVIGTVEVTRAILPSMIDRRDGRIVLVCSQAGQV